MAFVPWDYQVKMVTPGLSWATIPMFLTNPWRLSLLFVVSGYASAALLAKQAKVSTFLPSRLLRLGVPLLFGMAVVVVPQPWVWLVTHFDYAHSFGYFLLHDYYRFQSIDGVVMPTWMHLWFVAYLLVYTLLLCGVLLVMPVRWRQASLAAAERILAGPMLLPIEILWVYGTRTFLGGGWEESHALVGDWTAHANYVPAFLFGLALRSSEPLRSTISRWWPVAAAAAVGGWLILAGVELAWPGDTVAPHWVWLPYDAARAVKCWCADRHRRPVLERRSPLAASVGGGGVSLLHHPPDDHRRRRILAAGHHHGSAQPLWYLDRRHRGRLLDILPRRQEGALATALDRLNAVRPTRVRGSAPPTNGAAFADSVIGSIDGIRISICYGKLCGKAYPVTGQRR